MTRADWIMLAIAAFVLVYLFPARWHEAQDALDKEALHPSVIEAPFRAHHVRLPK